MGNNIPQFGFGLGLRSKHIPYILEHKPKVDWFEIISENYMDNEGRAIKNLEMILQDYPVVMHGVSLSIGSTDEINFDYLTKLKRLIKIVQPPWITDHLCWCGINQKTTHDLLPLPYNEESLQHVISRIKIVQDFLEMNIGLENPSTYLSFKSSNISESEFIAHMVEATNCNLLLDVNNVYVNCYNHHLDVKQYIDALPLNKIVQIHLSGHTNKGTHIIDTHDDYVVDGVWNIYQYVVNKSGQSFNTMIEWDGNIPDFQTLYNELELAKTKAKSAIDYDLPIIKQFNIATNNDGAKLETQQIKLQQAIFIGDSEKASPQEWIVEKPDFSPNAQLKVYVNAYRWRLFDVVAEDYPILKNYMGDERFNELINDFIHNNIPQDYNIARYAARLSEYFKSHKNYDGFGYELCQVETAIAQLVDFPETTPLNPDYLQQITPNELMEINLPLRKAMQLFALNHNINDYYKSIINAQPISNIISQNTWLAIFRHDATVWRMDLEELEYDILMQFLSGKTVGEALEKYDATITENISKWFGRWINNGLLAQLN